VKPGRPPRWWRDEHALRVTLWGAYVLIVVAFYAVVALLLVKGEGP
jgi:hypothetical protein